MRALPWFISLVCLVIAGVCAGYVMWLDYDTQTSVLAETVRAQQARVERLQTEVTALRRATETDQTRISELECFERDAATTSITLSTRVSQTRRDMNDLWTSLLRLADADRVSARFSRTEAQIHDLAQAAAKDVASLHARIDATQKSSRSAPKPDAFVNVFLAQMPKDPVTP
jgi:hypothetical protein